MPSQPHHQGTRLNHVVPADTTVNGEYYAKAIQTILPKAIRRKQLDQLGRGFILHQDNAPVHKAKIVPDTLKT